MPPDPLESLRKQALQDNATPSELRRLEAGPDAIVIRVAPELGGELVVGEPGSELPPPLEELGGSANAETRQIVKRISLRARLGLPRRECAGRRRRGDCRCLQEALDRAKGKGWTDRSRSVQSSYSLIQSWPPAPAHRRSGPQRRPRPSRRQGRAVRGSERCLRRPWRSPPSAAWLHSRFRQARRRRPRSTSTRRR
jgi:hypothetical protein